MQSSITIKGQITLPAELRKRFGLKQGQKVMFAATKEGILVKPVEMTDLTQTAEWRRALDESLAEADSGKTQRFGSDEAFLDHLQAETKRRRR